VTKKLKLLFAALMLLPFLSFATVGAYNPLCPTTNSSGNCTSGACVGKAASSPACVQAKAQDTNNPNPVAGPNGIINTAANIIALVAGIGSVIVIIISGFMFVTAGGAAPGQRSTDPNRLKTARSALSGAIVGLIIVALAWSIVRFVTNWVIQ
jgi:hypothetical protein